MGIWGFIDQEGGWVGDLGGNYELHDVVKTLLSLPVVVCHF